jgi:DNA replication protein DnaC
MQAILDIDTIEDIVKRVGAQQLHDEHCDFGSIRVRSGNYEQSLPCPHCEEERRLGRFKRDLLSAGVGERYMSVTWDDLELVEPLPALKSASARISDIIRAGHSLVLAGPPGTGKTQSAVLLVRDAITAGHTALMVNIGRTAMEVRAGYKEKEPDTNEKHETHRMISADLLVLDDVGAGEAGDAKVEKRLLYFVTEARQNARKPTIVTSNLNAAQVRDFLGDRIMNRLMPVEVVNFTHGRNFRAPKGTKTLWSAA